MNKTIVNRETHLDDKHLLKIHSKYYVNTMGHRNWCSGVDYKVLLLSGDVYRVFTLE